MFLKRLLLTLCLTAACTTAALCAGPDSCQALADGCTVRTMLFGAGRNRLLDTYLSPLNYAGPTASLTHLSERQARWGRGRVTVMGLYGVNATYAQPASKSTDTWDAGLTLAGGWHYNWQPAPRLRLALGGLMEASGGFTYNNRNGNNPAQGRAAADVAMSGIAAYDFCLFKRTLTARAQLDVPLAGVMFSPRYGQSYYEIFGLHHGGGDVIATCPVNAPSARLLATLTFPLAGARITMGYMADVRQSNVNHLKRHSWNQAFVVGFTRRIRLLR